MDARLVTFDDWVALYVDGRKEYEGHSMDLRDFAERFAPEVAFEGHAGDALDQLVSWEGHVPDTLEELRQMEQRAKSADLG